MDIPYTVEVRRDTGLTNGKIGIWLFLASEVMLFGALFSTYIILRIGSTAWPHGALNVPLGAINTVILISSSVTMVLGASTIALRGASSSDEALRAAPSESPPCPGMVTADVTVSLLCRSMDEREVPRRPPGRARWPFDACVCDVSQSCGRQGPAALVFNAVFY